MELENLINDLRDMYQDSEDIELFDETIELLKKLYSESETAKSIIDLDDIDALSACLLDVYQNYLNKYLECTNILVDLCSRNDYNAIAKYITDACNELTQKDINIDDPKYIGKINMVIDFYGGVWDHDFTKVFEYTKNCKLLNNLVLMITNYKVYNENKKNR